MSAAASKGAGAILLHSAPWRRAPARRRWLASKKGGCPSYETAITKWLRPEDIARYEKIADPWVEVSKNFGQ